MCASVAVISVQCVWRFCLVIKQLLMWTRGLSTCSIINPVAKRLPRFGESEVLPQYGDLVFRSQRMVSELTISFCVHIHVSQCQVTSLPFCIWLYRLVLNLGYSFCFWYPLLILFWNKLWNIKLNVCHCSLIYGFACRADTPY